jgi:hypothetical protein
VKPDDLLLLLQDFYRDKLALYRRHEAGARLVSGYDANNTYQYILAREDTHLEWLRRALTDLGAQPDDTGAAPAVPPLGKGKGAARALFEDDARMAGEFVARWRERVAKATHAPHRKMLELTVGETAEHQRFFEQAVAGRVDLLGRRPDTQGTGGGVMPTRWVE